MNTINSNTIQHRISRGIKSGNEIFIIKKIKNQKKWTRDEDELLISLALRYKEKHWKEISRQFFNKNSLQCFSRYKRIRPGIIKGSWKKEEDLKIIEMIQKYGKVWSKISKILGTRNGKQIRDRFINVLDPEIKKGKFTDEEDTNLTLFYKEYGPKWATIAKYFPSRTADMVKNRFHSSIKRKISSQESHLKDCEMTIANLQTKEAETYLQEIKPTDSFLNNLSLQTSAKDSSSENLIFLNNESVDNKIFESSIKEDLEFYTQNINNFNCDFLSCEKEIKTDDSIYDDESINWNFENYFNIL